MVTDLRKDRFFHQSRHCANVCIFLFEMSLSMFFIFRQRSSSYTIVAVGFCKACLFFFFLQYSASSAALLLPHSCHLCPQDLKSSMFVLNLVIIDSLTIHSPPFFASLQYYTAPFSACFSFLSLMYIRTADKLLLLLKQKTGREKGEWLLPSRR